MKKLITLLLLFVATSIAVATTTGNLWMQKRTSTPIKTTANDDLSERTATQTTLQRTIRGTHYELPAKTIISINGIDTYIRYSKYDTQGRLIEKYNKTISDQQITEYEKLGYHTYENGKTVNNNIERLSFNDKTPFQGYKSIIDISSKGVITNEQTNELVRGLWEQKKDQTTTINAQGLPTAFAVNGKTIDTQYDSKGRLIKIANFYNQNQNDTLRVTWSEDNLPTSITMVGYNTTGSEYYTIILKNIIFKKTPAIFFPWNYSYIEELFNTQLSPTAGLYDCDFEMINSKTNTAIQTGKITSTIDDASRTYTRYNSFEQMPENNSSETIVIEEDLMSYTYTDDQAGYRNVVKYNNGFLVEQTTLKKDENGNYTQYQNGTKWNYTFSNNRPTTCTITRIVYNPEPTWMVTSTERYEYSEYIEPNLTTATPLTLVVTANGGGSLSVANTNTAIKNSTKSYKTYNGTYIELHTKNDYNHQLSSLVVNGVEQINNVYNGTFNATITQNSTINAQFTRKSGNLIPINLSIIGDGSIIIDEQKITSSTQLDVIEGETLSMRMYENDFGQYFKSIQIGDSIYTPINNNFEYTVTKPQNITVTFVENKIVSTNIQVVGPGSINLEGSNITNSTTTINKYINEYISIPLNPASNAFLKSVYINGKNVTHLANYNRLQLSKELNEDTNSLIITFAEKEIISFEVTIIGKGLEQATGSFYCNGNALTQGTFTTSNVDYEGQQRLLFYFYLNYPNAIITQFIINGTNYAHLITNGSLAVNNITEGGTIHIEVENPYRNVTINHIGKGAVWYDETLLSSGSTIQIAPHDPLSLGIYAESEYRVDKIMYNGSNITHKLKDNNRLTLDSLSLKNSIINITFVHISTPSTLTLTIKSAENGSINLKKELNTTEEIEISPSPNWKINTVRYNNKDVTNNLIDNTFVTPPITFDSELKITFELISTNIQHTNASLKVYTTQDKAVIEGVEPGTIIAIYGTDGTLINSHTATSTTEYVTLSSSRRNYIIRVATRSFKVIL